MKTFWGKIYGFISNHALISSSTLFVLTLAIVLVVVLNVSDKNADAAAQPNDVEGSTINKGETDNIQDLTLRCDEYAEINEVMEAYHKAQAENDAEVLKKYLLYINENELVNIEVKSKYIEGYEDVHCYTQEGYEEGSYYVYVSYQLKLTEFETTIPGLVGLYYCPNEDGEYHIYRKADMSENVLNNYYTAYMKQEVQDLYNTVDMSYNEVLDGNPDIKTYMDSFEELVTEEMVVIIAARENSETLPQEGSEADSSETDTSEETSQETTTEIVMATTTVNVRKTDSENAEKLGKVSTGTKLTRLEEKINGWSKVIYEGKEGYIKSEYLEVVSTEDGGGTSTGNYVTVKENVNIRASASETGDRIALAYQGTKLELIEHMSNGWTKIKYNGKEAYVKSDYVE